jgi:hypothetical protein
VAILAAGTDPQAAPDQSRAPRSNRAHDAERKKQLADGIRSNSDLQRVLALAKTVLTNGLNAGDGYGEVWIRDLNTFIDLALEVQPGDRLRQSLLTFLHFQGPDGNIVDGYVATESATGHYQYIGSATMPQFMGYKNTVETDQESSLVQAVHKYVQKTGDRAILEEPIDGVTVRDRLSKALEYPLQHRFSRKHGLIWGATTVDWGDVQPEHPWGVELDASSHRAIDVYDNAMFVIALNDYLDLTGGSGPAARWRKTASQFKARMREHLWDRRLHKFRPHIYLDGSPFPPDFDEQRIHYHGGTAIAVEAGVLSDDEVRRVLNDMINNRRFAGAASIGLAIYPPYPDGFFKNAAMKPFSYQNGGDWTWFGGRMIQQLVRYGEIERAYQEILPMVERAKRDEGFFEWYTPDNRPFGSGTYRGAAGVLGTAIQMLLDWADQQPR